MRLDDAEVLVLPVLHERLESADQVRLALAALEPDAVAVEIPSTLERLWLAAVDRLPLVSVLLYETAAGATIYLPVHPADPLVEAARGAREAGLPLRCADLDVDGYADYRDPVPDPYAMVRLGAARYVEALLARPRPRDPADQARERSMAHHVRDLVAGGARRVLLACGMHHAESVVAEVGRAQAVPLTPPARRSARLVHLHPDSLAEVLPEIPFHVAVYERRRRGLPPAPHREADAALPAARRHGPFRVLDGGRHGDDDGGLDEVIARAAWHGGVAPRRDDGDGGDAATTKVPPPLDRLRLQRALLAETERTLAAAAPDEEVRGWQRRNLARFSRNLALASGNLVPDLFDLLAAARGCVSENFAWELHRLALAYPGQATAAPGLPVARIRADQMYDGVRRIRLERRIRRPKRPDWRTLLRSRAARRSERFPGEWLKGFDGTSLCSYPPEDVIVEEFGRYLRRRGKLVLSEERSRTVPFTTSVLDGIDVRETIRHWSEGRIYVRELGRAPGGVGAVVVVFDEDETRYPYEQTWIGEHDQESDMAFYCTDPADAVIGPGICRVSYGGFLMSHPPRRMADVWTDPDYVMAESRAEVLLLAALDYCSDRLVVHVAPRPPRSILRQLAERLGLKIVHVPLGTLSPSTLRRIRVMHILSGHDKREVAREYVW